MRRTTDPKTCVRTGEIPSPSVTPKPYRSDGVLRLEGDTVLRLEGDTAVCYS